ncbi:MAG: FAD-dependent oxidoreductase, partial [Candidatus Falkowbacteria bacterium]
LNERRILGNIAPNYVYPIPFMFINPTFIMKIGLFVYDLLAFDKKFTWDKSKKIPNHYPLSREEVIEKVPNTKRDDLQDARVYYDSLSIFPERLTLSFIKSAIHYEAKVSNYTKVEDFFITESNKVSGIVVRDLLNKRLQTLKGKLTINCTGPWADIVLKLAKKGDSHYKIRRSEGIHLIVKDIINKQAVGTMTKKGHFFLIPWRGHSLIGTTDKEYPGTPEEYHVTRQSIQELLDTVNMDFGNYNTIQFSDVLFSYGGLRPLLDAKAEDVHTTTRKYEIYDHSDEGFPGLITVEGGKYTTSRNLAENVLKTVEKRLGVKLGKCKTHKQRLIGCEIENIENFIDSIKKENCDFRNTTLEYLGRNYGTEYGNVLKFARQDKRLAEIVNDDGEILAQEEYAIKNISFSAKPKEVTAIIGSTGSGKSTLINLIPRFYEISSGNILIDGVDVKNIPHDWIHEIITLNINTCKTQKNYLNINLQDRVVVLGFETPEICEQFYQEFNTNMSRAINAYLASINEDPKKYNRIIVIESATDSQQITLRF